MFPDTWIVKRQIAFPQTESTWGWKKQPTVTIYPIGDLHLGSIGCHEKEWGEFCNFIQNEPDSYICVVGDMLDNTIVSGAVGNPWDCKYRPMEQKNILSEFLKPISDKILCAVRGNHEARNIRKGGTDQDPLYDVFCRLNIEERYRAGTAFLYLQIGERPNGSKGSRPIQAYRIVVTHGTGGGKLAGSAINNQQRFGMVVDCDVLITGHTHAPSITKPSRVIFDPVQKEVTTQPFACVQCASWLAYSGYPLEKMLPPQTAWSNDVPQKIELCGQRDIKLIRATM